MRSGQSTFWRDYYDERAVGQPWLDYSNARVHAQTLAVCIEAAGDVHDKDCLDLGCGLGGFSGALRALGAASIVGVDIVDTMIEQNRLRFPDIDWRQGDASDDAFFDTLPTAERVFLVELAQYVDLEHLLPSAWRKVRPGGRLVGMVPNAACPIVRRAMERFGGHYRAAPLNVLATLADSLEGLESWGARGLSFGDDQRILPYEVGPWTTVDTFVTPPNRLNFAFLKTG